MIPKAFCKCDNTAPSGHPGGAFSFGGDMTKEQKESLIREDYAKILEWMDKNVIPGNPWPEGHDCFYLVRQNGGIYAHFGVSSADNLGRQFTRIKFEGSHSDILGMPEKGQGVREMEDVILKWHEEKEHILTQLNYSNRIRDFEP